MGYRTHVAGVDGLRITRVDTTEAVCDYFDDPDFDDVPAPALIFDDGGNGEAFVVCGDLEGFVRQVVKAMPNLLLTTLPDQDQVDRMREVFKLVSPHAQGRHWKDEISARIPNELATVTEVIDAVVFMAGGVPEVYEDGDELVVTGAGYWGWGMGG